MHAITVREPGGPDVMSWQKVADPTPGPSRVPRPSRRGARASRPMRGKHDARGAAAALLTLRRVRNDDILAGDGLAAGFASMFRLRNGLRGSQSRMA